MNKLRNFITCSLLAVLFISCAKKKVEIPAGILSKDELIPVLVDVHLAQAATSIYNASDTARYNMNDYLPYILKIHHLTQAEYDSTISFYTRHPEIMKEVYEKVISELSKKQSEVVSH